MTLSFVSQKQIIPSLKTQLFSGSQHTLAHFYFEVLKATEIIETIWNQILREKKSWPLQWSIFNGNENENRKNKTIKMYSGKIPPTNGSKWINCNYFSANLRSIYWLFYAQQRLKSLFIAMK